ncbi:MAG: hypothetical protein WDN28_02735 [Chthoniobacter sp.]
MNDADAAEERTQRFAEAVRTFAGGPLKRITALLPHARQRRTEGKSFGHDLRTFRDDQVSQIRRGNSPESDRMIAIGSETVAETRTTSHLATVNVAGHSCCAVTTDRHLQNIRNRRTTTESRLTSAHRATSNRLPRDV